MRKAVTLVLLLAVAVLGALYLLQPADAPAPAQGNPRAAASSEVGARDLSAASVLRIDPSKAQPRPPAPSHAAVVSADLAQLRRRDDWAGLYQRVTSGPRTAESRYIEAEIYSACATHPPVAGQPGGPSRAQRRENFIAELQGDPHFEARLAAWDKREADPCVGVTAGTFSKDELKRLLDAAVAAGDPRARSWQLSRAIEEPYYDTHPNPGGYGVSDAQLDAMRELLASGDPQVVRDLQGILSSSLTDGALRIDNERIDGPAMHAALGLFACDLGAPCGADSPPLLFACAQQGRCDAHSLYEYNYFYGASPAEAQEMDHYHQALLQMANSHDFSGLTIVRGPRASGYSSVFGGRHGP
jgi:hypothetical protein